MSDFDSVLAAAQRLPEEDRLRLIDALWDSVPEDSDNPFSEEWTHEIKRRVADIDAGRSATVPWEQVRNAALARIGRAKAD